MSHAVPVHEIFIHMVRALGDGRFVPLEKRSDTANMADWVYMCLGAARLVPDPPVWDQLKAESEAEVRGARERALVQLVAYTSQAIREARALPDPEGDATEEEAREWDEGVVDRARARVAAIMPEVIFRVMRTLAQE